MKKAEYIGWKNLEKENNFKELTSLINDNYSAKIVYAEKNGYTLKNGENLVYIKTFVFHNDDGETKFVYGNKLKGNYNQIIMIFLTEQKGKEYLKDLKKRINYDNLTFGGNY